MWAVPIVIGTLVALWVAWKRTGLKGWDFIILYGARVYAQFWHRWWSNGKAPLPVTGPVLVVANHTCSADPTFLLAGCPRTLGFLVAREHSNIHPLARLLLDYLGCVPVMRNGRDPVSFRRALRRLHEGGAVCLFPEGNLSGVSRNRLRAAKLGIALLALVSRAPVYPAYIAGGPRSQQLLAAWVHRSPRPVRVAFGQAVDLSAYFERPRTRQLLEEITALLMAKVEALNPEKKKRGGRVDDVGQNHLGGAKRNVGR